MEAGRSSDNSSGLLVDRSGNALCVLPLPDEESIFHGSLNPGLVFGFVLSLSDIGQVASPFLGIDLALGRFSNRTAVLRV